MPTDGFQNSLLTLFHMLILAGIAWTIPLVGLFILILLPQPGVAGPIQEVFGLKHWAGQPACLLLGYLALVRMLPCRKSDRFWPVVMLASSGLYIFVSSLLLRGNILQASFSPVFHGGMLAAFFIFSWSNTRFWNVVLAGMLVLLILSAATYWLSGSIPFFLQFNGMAYSSPLEGTATAESVMDLIERAMRGAGVFNNPNCWAQVSALGVVIGLAMAVLARKRSRVYGLVLLSVSILGMIGSLGRSAILSVVAGAVCLVGGRYLTRSVATRLSMIVAVVVIGWVAVHWAQERNLIDSTFQFGIEHGMEYRTDQLQGVAPRIGEYWLMGSKDAYDSIKEDDPHDIVLASVFYFGLFPALMMVLAIVGGLLATARWIAVGGERLGEELGLPGNLYWAGHVVVPVFIVVMVNGLANGLAGGTPYRELFLMYIYIGVRVKRYIVFRPLSSLRPSGAGLT